jgi:hypothetical protein
VKTFDELELADQLRLCLEVFRAMAGARARTIARTADVREQSPALLWEQMCEQAGLDRCEPWIGYPDKLLPTETDFWTRLAENADDDAKQRARDLQGLMLALSDLSSLT